VLPGAIEVLSTLRSRAIPFVVADQTAAPTGRQSRRADLRSIGLPVEDGQMLTPSSVAADLMRRAGITGALGFWAVPAWGDALAESGIDIAVPGGPRAQDVQAVVRGLASRMHHEGHRNRVVTRSGPAPNSTWRPMFRSSRLKQGRAMGYSYAIVGAIRRVTKARVLLNGQTLVACAALRGTKKTWSPHP